MNKMKISASKNNLWQIHVEGKNKQAITQTEALPFTEKQVPISVYAWQWDCWVIRQFYFQFFKESPRCSA